MRDTAERRYPAYRFFDVFRRVAVRARVRATGFLAVRFDTTRADAARLREERDFATEAFLAAGLALGFASAAGAATLAGCGLATGVVGVTAFAATAGAGRAAAPGALGLLLGRPPLRANCASANILANASFASAISCACEIRRS